MKIEGIEPDDEEAAYAEDERIRIEALHKTAPKRIWLQIDYEAEQFDGWDAQTWCTDKINHSDVEYVRADQLRAAQVKALRDAAPTGLDALVRSLHLKMPMATQEDAIAFAHRLVAELTKQKPHHYPNAEIRGGEAVPLD